MLQSPRGLSHKVDDSKSVDFEAPWVCTLRSSSVWLLPLGSRLWRPDKRFCPFEGHSLGSVTTLIQREIGRGCLLWIGTSWWFSLWTPCSGPYSIASLSPGCGSTVELGVQTRFVSPGTVGVSLSSQSLRCGQLLRRSLQGDRWVCCWGQTRQYVLSVEAHLIWLRT